ncbi:MAG: hypothetical protein ACRDJE_16085 [Dehalococcoidia bacterium]
MARAPATVDVSHIPELVRLAKEVAEDGHSRVLHAGGTDLAVLSPAAARRARRGPQDADSTQRDINDHVIAELKRRRQQYRNWATITAGILKPYARIPPPTPREEKDAFEHAVADQVMVSMRR